LAGDSLPRVDQELEFMCVGSSSVVCYRYMNIHRLATLLHKIRLLLSYYVRIQNKIENDINSIKHRIDRRVAINKFDARNLVSVILIKHCD
jgi:hypothetical protein